MDWQINVFSFHDLNNIIKDTVLNGHKIWHFEDPHIWLVLILAILGKLRV